MDNELSAAQILNWFITAGVDETVSDTPVDRFALPSPSASAAGRNAGRPPVGDSAPESDGTQASSLQSFSVARTASSLEELKKMMSDFDGCPLKSTATNMVFGSGNPNARLMIIGEAPGAEEDRQGLPFVGASGRLLDLMLSSIGLKRQDIYITNILPWRPPANRKPSESEMALFAPFVRRHIFLINPEILLFLGGSAVSALMDTAAGITKTRGRWMTYSKDGMSVPALASFHPAYLLRTPAQKKLAWRDFLTVREKLNVTVRL